MANAGQEHFRHRRRSSALKLDKSTLFPPSFDKTAREMKAAKCLLGLRAKRSWVTGLRISTLVPGKGCRKVQRPRHRPRDSTFESAHHRTGSGVFICGFFNRQSHGPVIRGFGIGGARVTQHPIPWPGGGAGLPAVSGQGLGGQCPHVTHGPKPSCGAVTDSGCLSRQFSGRASSGSSSARSSGATRRPGRRGPGRRRRRTPRGCRPAARCAPSAAP